MGKSVSFGDMDRKRLVLKANLKVETAITDLIGKVKSGYTRNMLNKFRCIVYPGRSLDLSRLPLYSTDGYSRYKNEDSCLLEFVGSLIRTLWLVHFGSDKHIEQLNTQIAELQEFARYGTDAYMIVGSVCKYRLVKKSDDKCSYCKSVLPVGHAHDCCDSCYSRGVPMVQQQPEESKPKETEQIEPEGEKADGDSTL